MNEKEIKIKKKELMKPGWTEDLHLELEELNQKDSKKIVELMTDSDIYHKVNNRKFQQDYIADYLMYLWEISEPAFWKHIKSTFDFEEGLLWADHMKHYETLTDNEIPNEILNSVLKFAFQNEKIDPQDAELIFCIIKAQVSKFDKLDEINKFISHLPPNLEKNAKSKIASILDFECNYLQY